MRSLDPIEVLAGLGWREPTSIAPVAGGVDAAIWRVEQTGSAFALRVLQPDQAEQANRETDAMARASAAGLPVPIVIASGSWKDHPVVLLEWARGRPLGEALLADSMSLERVCSLGGSFGETQAAIHRLPPPPGLRSDWLNWPVSNPALREHFAAIELRPAALLHLDYHPLNVLVDGDRITAVLDWANAHGGDPRADLARTLAILQLAPLPAEVDETSAYLVLNAFEQSWRTGYEAAGGSFDGLAPFCWWAGTAMAHDLAPRLGRADIPWLTPAYFTRIQAWTAQWREIAIAGE